MTVETRPDGRTIEHTYDNAGRLVHVDGDGLERTYDHDDQTGKLESITSSDGAALNYTYDGFLRTEESWSGPVSGSVSYDYTQDFQVSDLTINQTPAIGFSRDQDLLLTGAGGIDVIRDADTGRIASTHIGEVDTYTTYDDYGEEASFAAYAAGDLLYEAVYTRDLLGRIATVVETVEDDVQTIDYAYDLDGRLTDVMINGQLAYHYEYDANSNRLVFEDNLSGTTETGSYDEQDRLVEYADATYDHTENGERLFRVASDGGQTTYDYDVFGNLREVALPGGELVSYAIDPEDRRIAKDVDGSRQAGWLYDGPLNVVAELNPDDSTRARFVYATKGHAPGLMLAEDGSTYRLITDARGSVRLAVDVDTGQIVQRMDYTPFGRVLEDTNPGLQPFGFAGGLWDDDTGLVRFGARDYDPETGRWTAKDPIRFDGGDTNLYGYVMGDPVNFVDPSGLAVDRDTYAPVPDNYCDGNDDNKEHCIRLYFRCKEDNWTGPCDDCLNYCTAQGEWPFGLCYPR